MLIVQKIYDYIVVGGGSAGCVIAARLSEDPNIKVLLLEAGGSENLISEVPSSAMQLQGTSMDWQYVTVPQQNSCRGLIGGYSKWPRGKVLGGSSTINFMMYIRGNRHDYDNWAASGATGWKYEDTLPYFIKSEDNQDEDIALNGYHGQDGPLTVMRTKYVSELARSFVEAGTSLGKDVLPVNFRI